MALAVLLFRMDIENSELGLSIFNIFKRSQHKRSKVKDSIAVIGVTQAVLIGRLGDEQNKVSFEIFHVHCICDI